jgi:segregation and condensation protein A
VSSSVHHLELDLDVFAGPFDLLLSLILREELDLLEVDLADIVIAYVDHLERREELDLESTTEFLVLIAALLELKSRLMLPGEEVEELDELVPAEAADELLARMLAYLRYRGAAAHLREAHEEGGGFLFRSALPPAGLRRASLDGAEAVFSPGTLGKAVGGLLRLPAPVDLTHMRSPAVSVGERLGVLRGLLRRGRFSFDDAVAGADRMTVCVTLYALLEMYKRGEAAWEQEEPFGEITVGSTQVPGVVAIPLRGVAA